MDSPLFPYPNHRTTDPPSGYNKPGPVSTIFFSLPPLNTIRKMSTSALFEPVRSWLSSESLHNFISGHQQQIVALQKEATVGNALQARLFAYRKSA